MKLCERQKVLKATAVMVHVINSIEHDEKSHDYLMEKVRQMNHFVKKDFKAVNYKIESEGE